MLKDNSVVFNRPVKVQEAKPLTWIYPPPNAEEIVFCKFCVLSKRLIMLTARSNILFYRLEKKVSTQEQVITYDMLKDSEGKGLQYDIRTIEICCTEVPPVDHVK